MMQHKLLGFFVVFSIMAMGISIAYADISVHQDNTPEEKVFLELIGSGEHVTYTEGIGITYLTSTQSGMSVSAYQDNTPEETLFLQLRSAGEWVSYTYGIGITYLSHPLIEAAWGEEQKEFKTFVPFDYQNSGCTLTLDTPDYKEYECSATWKSSDFKYTDEETTPSEDGCASGMDIDIRTGECRPFGEIQEEAKQLCSDDPLCPLGVYTPEPQPNPKTEGLYPNVPTDAELIKRINAQLDSDPRCYQGLGTTLGIQNTGDFSIPVREYTIDGVTHLELDLSVPDHAMNYGGMLKEILSHAQECKAQMKLQNDQGGVLSSPDRVLGYCDRFAESLTVEQSIQAGCGMTSGSYYKSLHADVPVMTQEMANQKANFGIEKAPLRQHNDYVCSHNYAESLRVAYGCPPLPIPEKGNGKIPVMTDYHDNLPGEKYTNYLKDDGARQGKNLAKEAIQKKIASLMEMLRSFK